MRDGMIEERIAYINNEYEQKKALRDKEEMQTLIKEQKPDISKQQAPKQKPDNEQGYRRGM